jgi:hypothetical protein
MWRVWAGAIATLLAAYVWVGRSLSPAADQGLARSDRARLAALRADDTVIGGLGPLWSQERVASAWEALDREEWLSR